MLGGNAVRYLPSGFVCFRDASSTKVIGSVQQASKQYLDSITVVVLLPGCLRAISLQMTSVQAHVPQVDHFLTYLYVTWNSALLPVIELRDQATFFGPMDGRACPKMGSLWTPTFQRQPLSAPLCDPKHASSLTGIYTVSLLAADGGVRN